jgi:hypothetical protein
MKITNTRINTSAAGSKERCKKGALGSGVEGGEGRNVYAV